MADTTQASPSDSAPTFSSEGPSPSASEPGGSTLWLCHPNLDASPCQGDLDTTVVLPDGSRTDEPFAPAPRPSVDCFYVYPTVSTAPTRNAPLEVSPEIVRVVRAQAALFQDVCALYAPVYRQITLQGLVSGGLGDAQARALAEQDVIDAFSEYLRGAGERRFLLLGHSQGATVLTSMIQQRIDGNAGLRSRLLSAMLLGGSVFVQPDGLGVETRGSFQNIPPCRTPTQTACVVAYNTYGGTPPELSLFGRAADGRRILCVNPAALSGGPAPADPIVPIPSAPGVEDVVGFGAFPDSATAECRRNATNDWLEVTRLPGSQLPEQATSNDRGPAWGLHRVDVTLMLGDLIALAAQQAS